MFSTTDTKVRKAAGTLRRKRMILDLNQREVAERAGITLRKYQKYESGEGDLTNASFSTVCSVLLALEIDITGFYFNCCRERKA